MVVLRLAVLGLAVLGLGAGAAGCGVKLADDPTSHVVSDAPGATDGTGTVVDAVQVDARACEGGQKHQTGPNNECFVFFAELVTWAQAKLACEGIGARLAILDTLQKDNVAETMLTVDTFFGATDVVLEGRYVWMDGTAITATSYTNWHTGEPNNGAGAYEEDCIVVAGARIGKAWDDRPCAPETGAATAGRYGYLCEY